MGHVGWELGGWGKCSDLQHPPPPLAGLDFLEFGLPNLIIRCSCAVMAAPGAPLSPGVPLQTPAPLQLALQELLQHKGDTHHCIAQQ